MKSYVELILFFLFPKKELIVNVSHLN